MSPSPENVTAAIQAAWLAQDYYLALDLACRYGEVCPRCAERRADAHHTFVPPNFKVPAAAWRMLCSNCALDLMGVK